MMPALTENLRQKSENREKKLPVSIMPPSS